MLIEKLLNVPYIRPLILKWLDALKKYKKFLFTVECTDTTCSIQAEGYTFNNSFLLASLCSHFHPKW